VKNELWQVIRKERESNGGSFIDKWTRQGRFVHVTPESNTIEVYNQEDISELISGIVKDSRERKGLSEWIRRYATTDGLSAHGVDAAYSTYSDWMHSCAPNYPVANEEAFLRSILVSHPFVKLVHGSMDGGPLYFIFDGLAITNDGYVDFATEWPWCEY